MKNRYRFSMGAAYNTPKRGYRGYVDNANFSINLDIVRELNFERERINYRVAFDYLMLNVPEDTYGVTEDLFGLTGAFLYIVSIKSRTFYPFAGVGLGLYFNSVRLDTELVESSRFNTYFGGNLSLGLEINLLRSVVLIPEIKGHGMFVSGFNLSTNLGYYLNLALMKQKGGYSYRPSRRRRSEKTDEKE